MPTAANKPPQLAVLDNVARLVGRAQEAASYTYAMSDNPDKVEEFAASGKSHCTTALAALAALGAQIPGFEGKAPVESSVPLHLLNSPNNVALLTLLDLAVKAATEVDRERGWIDADGEAIGWAETLGGLALTVRTEVFGPAGRD